MALESASWGYTRIRGALANLDSFTLQAFPLIPENSWMTQIARNVTDVDDGLLRGKRYLILDRDARFRGTYARQSNAGILGAMTPIPKTRVRWRIEDGDGRCTLHGGGFF